VAETVHRMEKTGTRFGSLCCGGPVQQDLFCQDTPRGRYTVIASNREETAEKTVQWYHQRGETNENRIKELKLGFGIERLPCGTLAANAVFFFLGVLAYNLFVLFKLLALPPLGLGAKCAPFAGVFIRWRAK
jgi:hypothetical protein